jgi:hypothetical protein
MQDGKTLEGIVRNPRSQTSTTKRAVVVIDVGIATEENLDILRKNDFDYVCVSSCKLKDYRIYPSCCPVEIEDKKKQKIQLQKVISEKHNDYFLKIDSEPNSVKRNNPYNEHTEIGFDGFSKLLR